MKTEVSTVGQVIPFEALSIADTIPDHVRPNFSRHVTNPLSHVLITRTIDAMRPRFLHDLQENGRNSLRHAFSDVGTNAVRALSLIGTMVSHDFVYHSDKSDLRKVWHILTPRQQAAAKKFHNFVGTDSPDSTLFVETQTLSFTIGDIIHPHHPELELENPDNMIAFLEHQDTPSILRGFAMAGNGFVADLREDTRGRRVSTRPWREDLNRAVIVPTKDFYRTTRDLRDAAYASRKEPVRSSRSLEFTDGCPARHLKFRTDDPELFYSGLQLTHGQVGLLMQGADPVIRPVQVGEPEYQIVRDSYAETLHLFSDALKIVAGKKIEK